MYQINLFRQLTVIERKFKKKSESWNKSETIPWSFIWEILWVLNKFIEKKSAWMQNVKWENRLSLRQICLLTFSIKTIV